MEKKRKNMRVRIGVMVLATIFLFCSGQEVLPVNATEIGQGATANGGAIGQGVVVNEGTAIGQGATVTGPGPAVASYSIAADQPNISFGTIHQGDHLNNQAITISNTGTVDVNICWNVSDPEHSMTVDAPDTLALPVGGTTSFYIVPTDNLAPGNYTATLLFGDESDSAYVNGVQVIVSVTVLANTPYISSLNVTPATANVSRGSTCGFAANVSGGNNANLGVNWSVQGAKSTGTTIASNGCLTVAADESASKLTVTATSVQDASVSSSATVTLTGGNHTVSVQANPAGGGNVSGGGSVVTGGSLTVAAAPNNGFVFMGWTFNGNVVSQTPTYQIANIQSDMQLVAQFQQTACKVGLSINHDKAGQVTGGGTVAYGGSMALQAKPNQGYQFDGWKENGKIISKDANFQLNNIVTNRSITACFSQNTYLVNLVCNPQDTGKLSGKGTYNAGSNVKVKASAYQGYQFVNWTINGNVVSTSSEVDINNIGQDYTLVANFMKQGVKTYQITAGVTSANGSISPAGKTNVPEGGQVTYVITPKNGYRIQAVSVDNVQVGAVSSYAFTKVDGNHSIVAAFVPKENAVAAPAQTTTSSQNTNTSNSGTKENSSSQTAEPATTQAESDDYIMDMNTDEIEDSYDGQDLDTVTGVLQTLNLTEDAARDMVEQGEDNSLLKMAFEEGDLGITIHNEYADVVQETVESSYDENTSIPNFSAVLDGLFTEDEKMSLFKGNNIDINLNISDYSEFISKQDKDALAVAEKEGVKVLNYFDIIFMKTVAGESQLITELPNAMKVVMKIPEDLQKSDSEYCVVRAHLEEDGTEIVSILKDEDTNPDTITFTTDKFSAYAIASVNNSGSGVNIWVYLLIAVIILLAFTSIFTLVGVATRKRRK